jgi:hypothetical protein
MGETAGMRYEQLRAPLVQIAKDRKRLSKYRVPWLHAICVIKIDGKISALTDVFTELRQDAEVAQWATPKEREVLLGNIDRDLAYLESAYRANTHLYIVFSTTFAIAMALLSLILGVLGVLPVFRVV